MIPTSHAATNRMDLSPGHPHHHYYMSLRSLGMGVEEEITNFIVRELSSDAAHLRSVADLLEAGIIDSLGLIMLISFLEQTLHLKVNVNELTPDNFRTINAIVGFVAQKRGST
jgi:acyl carrier protein